MWRVGLLHASKRDVCLAIFALQDSLPGPPINLLISFP
jgi:hypothetical protein